MGLGSYFFYICNPLYDIFLKLSINNEHKQGVKYNKTDTEVSE